MTALAYPDPPLSTGRIRLRPWAESDIPAIVTACQDPAMSRFIPLIPSPYGENDARAWLALHEPVRQQGRGLELAIVDAADRMLGSIATRLAPIKGSASVGYWLTPAARGHGFASEALRLWGAWLLTRPRVGRLELTTAPENIPSQRVASACGFRQEGYLREDRITADGVRRDSVLWGLLAPGPAAQAERGPRVVWVNGSFGAGKSSAAAELKRRRPELTVFDPELVGFMLRESVPVPTGDFQDLPEWREVVAATAGTLARHQTGPVLVPMTLWRREYLIEIVTLLRTAGVKVIHALIDAPDEVLAARIAADTDDPGASGFRRARLVDYSDARDWLRISADLVIDSAGRSVGEVADRIEPLLDA